MTQEYTIENALRTKDAADVARALESKVHVLKDGIICDTESRGYPTPDNRSPLDLVVDATNGFIPLWAPNMTLRWRFQQRSLEVFVDPVAAAAYIRDLLGRALLAWG